MPSAPHPPQAPLLPTVLSGRSFRPTSGRSTVSFARAIRCERIRKIYTHPSCVRVRGRDTKGAVEATLDPPDDDLLSHGQSALSSARNRFTVLFGMGRGGANALWSSGILVRLFTGSEMDKQKKWFALGRCVPCTTARLGYSEAKVIGSSRTGN